nr:galactose-specific lectin nattectin-like [Syngnathus scovelli]
MIIIIIIATIVTRIAKNVLFCSQNNHCAAANSCPRGWTQLDCKCYIYEDEPRSFADAESVCNILGGNLASIHNDLENAFIVEVIRANGDETEGWIGLHDAILDTDYIWTDGSEEDFLNFDTTNLKEKEVATGDCVEINEGSK